MNNLVLAYLGDAIYELYVREYLINSGLCKVKDLQKKSIDYVSAYNQAKFVDKLLDNNILSDEEINIIKRARNTHSHASKTTDIVTYKKATGLEALIGYLYINDKKRLEEIIRVILHESIW